MVTTQVNAGREPLLTAETGQESDHAEDTAGQRAVREHLRAEALSKVRAAVASTSALTEADLSSYERIVLSEAALEQGGARTHEEKMRFLQQNVSLYIPQVIADARRMESQFLSMVSSLESKGMDRASAQRWRDWLKKDTRLWYQKKNFLTKNFPVLHSRWTRLLADEKTLETKIQSRKKASGKNPALEAYRATDYRSSSLSRREVIVNNALASLTAHESGRDALFAKAQSVLQGAAARGVLAPEKVSVWMRRIFQSNADDKLIADFLDGGGSNSLPSLVGRWAKVRGRFDAVEEKRTAGGGAQGFHFVTLDTFLRWHYDARTAYVEQAERRLQESPETAGYAVLLDIRRELDMEDWRSAQSLIEQAKKLPLSEKERGDLASMQQYLSTQQSLQPQTAQEKEHEADPNADMFKALAELQQMNGSVYSLYTRAMARGIGPFSALCSLMYNRCWCRKQAIMEDSDEHLLREQAKEETKDVVEHGHRKTYENNYIPGYGNDAIRSQNQGEWSPQVLHIANDPGAQAALVAKCEAQQNNYSFKYWSTLIPENLGYSEHQYIVFNLHWRLKSGLRQAGALSNEAVVSRPASTKRKKETGAALAQAA